MKMAERPRLLSRLRLDRSLPLAVLTRRDRSLPLAVLTRRDRSLPLAVLTRAVLTRSLINPRFAAKTIAAVSFTSSEGSKANLLPCKALAATFIPIDESPGDDV